jgi:hypothetical protein
VHPAGTRCGLRQRCLPQQAPPSMNAPPRPPVGSERGSTQVRGDHENTTRDLLQTCGLAAQLFLLYGVLAHGPAAGRTTTAAVVRHNPQTGRRVVTAPSRRGPVNHDYASRAPRDIWRRGRRTHSRTVIMSIGSFHPSGGATQPTSPLRTTTSTGVAAAAFVSRPQLYDTMWRACVCCGGGTRTLARHTRCCRFACHL